jgi:hypothetical protein
MPPDTADLDAIRGSVLDRLERHNRNVRLAIFGAAGVEALLIAMAIIKLDFSNRFEVIVFVLFVLTYSIVALGLLALGAHVSRVGDRVLAAVEGLRRIS